MGKPKRINVFLEVEELAESWINGNKSYVVERSVRAGSYRQLLPALVFRALSKVDAKVASNYLKAIMDVSCRD